MRTGPWSAVGVGTSDTFSEASMSGIGLVRGGVAVLLGVFTGGSIACRCAVALCFVVGVLVAVDESTLAREPRDMVSAELSEQTPDETVFPCCVRG